MYPKHTHFHFVGIGGIGMSGIASILAHQGYTISGCDSNCEQRSITQLRELGCSIFEGNNTNKCHAIPFDILIYSSAISNDNPELLMAQQKGILTISRARMLSYLMRSKQCIAIAGSHGKTTTSSFIAHIFLQALFNPTIIIGGYLSTISSNAHYGTDNIMIVEADESDGSLVHLYPTYALITNIDFEHLETYASLESVKNTFNQFIETLPEKGALYVCLDDEPLRSLLPMVHRPIISFSTEQIEADFMALNIALYAEKSCFDVWHNGNYLTTITLFQPGIHNVRNALGAFAFAYNFGITAKVIQKAFLSFKGVDRRFTYHGLHNGVELFDDYGHHPQEIYHTLLVARKRAKGRLFVIFQPHRYSRIQGLWHEFITLFRISSIDHLIITDIYAANEPPRAITATQLVKELQKTCPYPIQYIPTDAGFHTIVKQLTPLLQPGDLLLVLGAGTIHNIVQTLSLKRA